MAISAVPDGDLESLEIKLLSEAIQQRYGYDLRHFSLDPLKKALADLLHELGIGGLGALQERLLRDAGAFERLVHALSPSTERDFFSPPQLYRTLRKDIAPRLRTYPKLRVWHLGCASGVETYSLAIVLKEEGLYDRTQVYATDVGGESLEEAKSGLLRDKRPKRLKSTQYRLAGGKEAFSRYLTVKGGNTHFRKELAKHLLFFSHNYLSDSSFNEFQVIVVGTSLDNLEPAAKDKVHDLLLSSLGRLGFLWLGTSLPTDNSFSRAYQELKGGGGWYQRKG